MGLAERRAAEQFRVEQYPQWLSRIGEAAGFEVPVEVAWDQLAVNDYAQSYRDFFPQVYFQPLVTALAAVCIDDMGTEALRAGLHKIVVKNSGEYHNARGFAFQDGVLTIDHLPATNVNDVQERAKGLQRLLESQL